MSTSSNTSSSSQSSLNASLHDSSSENDEQTCYNSEEESCDVFMGFDESIEPQATDEEWKAYTDAYDFEQRQQREFEKRLDAEIEVRSWCKCSHCSIELLVNTSECMCCQEIDQAKLKMSEADLENKCITLHPGFQNVCLDRWVLLTAGVGLKTKANKSYQTLFNEGKKSESEYLRAVAYRQIVRFLWNCLGSSNRTPLPACVYNKIRTQFPSDDGNFRGFEEDDDENDDGENANHEPTNE